MGTRAIGTTTDSAGAAGASTLGIAGIGVTAIKAAAIINLGGFGTNEYDGLRCTGGFGEEGLYYWG